MGMHERLDFFYYAVHDALFKVRIQIFRVFFASANFHSFERSTAVFCLWSKSFSHRLTSLPPFLRPNSNPLFSPCLAILLVSSTAERTLHAVAVLQRAPGGHAKDLRYPKQRPVTTFFEIQFRQFFLPPFCHQLFFVQFVPTSRGGLVAIRLTTLPFFWSGDLVPWQRPMGWGQVAIRMAFSLSSSMVAFLIHIVQWQRLIRGRSRFDLPSSSIAASSPQRSPGRGLPSGGCDGLHSPRRTTGVFSPKKIFVLFALN